METLKFIAEFLTAIIEKGAVIMYVIATTTLVTAGLLLNFSWPQAICIGIGLACGGACWTIHDRIIKSYAANTPEAKLSEIHSRISSEHEYLVRKYSYEFRTGRQIPCIEDGVTAFEKFQDTQIAIVQSLKISDAQKSKAIRDIQARYYVFQQALEKAARSAWEIRSQIEL